MHLPFGGHRQALDSLEVAPDLTYSGAAMPSCLPKNLDALAPGPARERRA